MVVRVSLEKFLRYGQTFLPGGSETKYALQRTFRRMLKRPFEMDFRALADLDLSRTGVFVDVGANRGQSIDAIRLILPGRDIVAFEPNQWLAQGLRRRYSKSGRLKIEQYALAGERGTATLHVPFYRDYMYDGLASLDRSAASAWLRSRIAFYADSQLEIREQVVECIRLDSLGLEVSFMKIDVQGLELSVLRGSVDTLVKHHPVLLIESPTEELQSFLSDLGYGPRRWTGAGFVEGIGVPNTFFW